jgi:hypothetical protein
VAMKKIPCVNEEGITAIPEKNNGWKMEMFIFDVFQHANYIAAFEVTNILFECLYYEIECILC